MAEYAAMSKDQRNITKDVGGFVGGRIQSGSRKAGNITDRQLVCLDADYADTSIWDAWELTVGATAVLHSTHSSTPDAPRFRLIIPLSRPISAAEYEPVARRLAEWIDINLFDDTTYEASRLMYWPSISKDAEYVFRYMDGDPVDPDVVLSSYADWHDISTWPTSVRRDKAIVSMGKVQGDPLTKPGIVGAFNRAYSITEAIETFIPDDYKQVCSDRWTYTKGTTTGGAVTYDNDTFLFSHHDTDPSSGRLCNAFDLVRIHLYGSEDEGHADDALEDLPSTHKMKELCAKDTNVCKELAVNVRADVIFDHDNSLQSFVGDTTEQGIAKMFCDTYGSSLRHSKAFGWMFWDGVRWILDADSEASMLCMQFADDLYSQARVHMQTATDKADEAMAKSEFKSASHLRSSAGMSGVMGLASIMLNEPNPSSYDSVAHEINTPDGIIDLRSGSFRSHDRDARCTKCTLVGPGGEGADKWLEFVKRISGGDASFATYLQRLAGMAAIGQVYEEGLVISHGPGGNGKSTFFGALATVMGDYAKTINADILVCGNNGNTDQSYIVALRGARLVIMGETEEGAHLSVSQMKRITSRDVISARALYKDPIEFTPVHTTIMHTNHLPRLGSLDGGTKRRIAVAPFPLVVPPEQVITDYQRVLVQECGPAIMQWIISGAIAFYADGCKLEKPPCVLQSTLRYVEGEDWLGLFIDDCCELSGECTGSELYAEYQRWANSQGDRVKRSRDFTEALETKGYTRVRRANARYWAGISIKTHI